MCLNSKNHQFLFPAIVPALRLADGFAGHPDHPPVHKNVPAKA